jgi:hypothetical protein
VSQSNKNSLDLKKPRRQSKQWVFPRPFFSESDIIHVGLIEQNIRICYQYAFLLVNRDTRPGELRFVCKFSGGAVESKKHDDPKLWRNRHSKRLDCPAFIVLKWATDRKDVLVVHSISNLHNHQGHLVDNQVSLSHFLSIAFFQCLWYQSFRFLSVERT